jgi:hypothetical protein
MTEILTRRGSRIFWSVSLLFFTSLASCLRPPGSFDVQFSWSGTPPALSSTAYVVVKVEAPGAPTPLAQQGAAFSDGLQNSIGKVTNNN